MTHNPVYSLKREGLYGQQIVMVDPETWEDARYSIDSLLQAYERTRPDLEAFLDRANRIVGFDGALFLSHLVNDDIVSLNQIPMNYRGEVEEYILQGIELQEEIEIEEPELISDEHFLGMVATNKSYMTLDFELPAKLDNVLFDNMDMPDDVILITYSKGEIWYAKQSTNFSPDRYDMITSRRIFNKDKSHDGITIYLANGRNPITIDIGDWFIKIMSTAPYDIDVLHAQLRDVWGINVFSWFISNAKYVGYFREIAYEPYLLNWCLTQTEWQYILMPKEDKSPFWKRANPSLRKVRTYLIRPPDDPYANVDGSFGLSASIKRDNVPIRGLERQPKRDERILMVSYIKGHGRHEGHAMYNMILAATAIKAVSHRYTRAATVLDALLQNVFGETGQFFEYLVDYQSTIYYDQTPSNLWDKKHHLDFHRGDNEFTKAADSVCTVAERAFYVPIEDKLIWDRAGYSTTSIDGQCMVVYQGKIIPIHVTIGNETRTYYCSGTEPIKLQMSSLSNVPALFTKDRSYPYMTPLDDLPVSYVLSGNQSVRIDHIVSEPAEMDSILTCVAEGYETTKDVIRKRLLESPLYKQEDFTGFLQHESILAKIEEIFGLQIGVFENGRAFVTNRKVGRYILLLYCTRNKLDQAFYTTLRLGEYPLIFPEDPNHSHIEKTLNLLAPVVNMNLEGIECLEPLITSLASGQLMYPALIVDNRTYRVTAQVIDVAGRRSLSVLNETHYLVHAPSAPFPVPTIDDQKFGSFSDYQKDFGHINNVTYSDHVAWIPKVGGFLLNDIPNDLVTLKDPEFIKLDIEAERTVESDINRLKEYELSMKVYLNAVAQAFRNSLPNPDILHAGDAQILARRFFNDNVVVVDNLSMERTQEPYTIMDTTEESIKLLHRLVTFNVDVDKIPISRRRVQELDDFIGFIASSIDYKNHRDIGLSPDGDARIYEVDYRQTDDVVTFNDADRYWAWIDNAKVGDGKTLRYISPPYSDRTTPYKVFVDGKRYYAFNTNRISEAFWATRHYNTDGKIPERVDMEISSEPISGLQYQKFLLSPHTSRLMRGPETTIVGRFECNILHYPLHYGKYQYAVLLEILDE